MTDHDDRAHMANVYGSVIYELTSVEDVLGNSATASAERPWYVRRRRQLLRDKEWIEALAERDNYTRYLNDVRKTSQLKYWNDHSGV